MDIAIVANETNEPHRLEQTVMQRVLDWIERVGNKVPHPVIV